MSLLVIMVSGSADARSLSSALTDVKVHCQLMKDWGRDDSNTPWFRYSMSCSIPRALRSLLERADPGDLVRQFVDQGARFTAATGFAALGRLHRIPAAERVRFVLELARRNNEPFASTRIGFVFGDQPWWARKRVPQIHNLGTLAAPWDRSMTPVIRSYLFPGLKHRPVSTLAVYLCTLMADSVLDPDIIGDLRRVVKMKPDSFEARMARETLKKLKARQ